MCPPWPRCSGKSKGLDVARTCPLQSREPPARRFSPVGTMVTDTLSHALHSSWGKYPDCHGMSLITARFQLAQEAIWARAPVPELMAAQLSHAAGLGGAGPKVPVTQFFPVSFLRCKICRGQKRYGWIRALLIWQGITIQGGDSQPLNKVQSPGK